MSNYFNSLNESEKKSQLSKCRFMNIDEFQNENNILKEKNIVIIGCGAQGLNQGLNMRDSGLNISFALRDGAISSKRKSFINASSNNFNVGFYTNNTKRMVLNSGGNFSIGNTNNTFKLKKCIN